MADFVFNQSLGVVNGYAKRVAENVQANSAIILALLSAAGADATLRDLDTFAQVIAEASTTETNATNYARKVLTDTDVTGTTVNDALDEQSTDVADQTWSSLGNGVNTALSDLLTGFDSDTTGGDDTNIVPITLHDFVLASTNSSDVTATIAGLWTAGQA